MKRYDQNAFIVLVLLCGLVLLLSCSTTRHTDTVTTVEIRDTAYTSVQADTVTAAIDRSAEQSDTVRQLEQVTGSLKIERDTAGRPFFYVWNISAFTQLTAGQKWHFDTEINGHASAISTDTAVTRAENVEKEEKKSTKLGPRLEDYVGVGLVACVILYLIYVLIEKLWKRRDR